MDTPHDGTERTDNVENVGSEATCAPGCDCNTRSSGGRGRWLAGVVILIVAGGLVARAMVKNRDAEDRNGTETFAVASPSAGARSEPGVTEQPTEDTTGSAALSAVQPKAEDEAIVTVAGKEIARLADLNEVAAQTDAVFVYLPGKKEEARKGAPSGPLERALRTLKAQGVKAGVFTLKAGGPQYTQLAAQIEVPGVVAMVKGRGMAPVTGDITESKLIQGFVAASSAGGCGPSGCGPKGCN